MRLNISAVALAVSLTTSIASPDVLSEREHGQPSPKMPFLEQNRLAVEQMPPTCNLIACVGLSGTLNCVLTAISAGDTAALRRCLSGGLGQICSCAACIPPVNNFLQALGICVTTASDEEGYDVGISSADPFTTSPAGTGSVGSPPLTRGPAVRPSTFKTTQTARTRPIDVTSTATRS